MMYAFNNVLKSRDFTQIVEQTLYGNHVKLDMTVSGFNSDSLIEFKYKNSPGFMNNSADYTYGFPKV